MEVSALPRSDTAISLLRICTNENTQCLVGAISFPWKGHKKKENVFDITASD